jgi:hypothetical protein
MKEHFKSVFLKNIESLNNEIVAFETDKDLWIEKKGITNSAGTLVLHLIGNLNHFIGAQLANTGYVRQREKEFSEKNVSKNDLLFMLNETKAVIEKAFDQTKEVQFFEVYPLSNFGEGKKLHEILLILLAHFNYHLGQINYYRRLV